MMINALKFDYRNSLVSKTEISKHAKKLESYRKHLNQVVKKNDHWTDEASILLPSDKKALKKVESTAKRFKNVKYVVVVGIGGSNLGTIAVQEAVLGKYYNQLTKKTKILFADTVDPDSLDPISKLIKQAKGNVVLNVISKSGSTAETIANFQVLLNVLKKQDKNYSQHVVATTGRGSKLWNLAKEKNFATLEIPEKVGGRYSVFTPVGLFPLALVGVDIRKLLKGAEEVRKSCLANYKQNPAMLSAIIQYVLNKKGKNISDFFLFSTDLESVGKWERQLMGESIGKEHDLKGKKVNKGMTPTVSIGSTDLHSMAQLYLGGPYDKFTSFVDVGFNNRIKVPAWKDFASLVKSIQGKELAYIMYAIYSGTIIAFRKNKRPFVEISLNDKKEKSIGELLQFKMMEMMYLAKLMNVNAFNQPNVELYKKETRKLLGV